VTADIASERAELEKARDELEALRQLLHERDALVKAEQGNVRRYAGLAANAGNRTRELEQHFNKIRAANEAGWARVAALEQEIVSKSRELAATIAERDEALRLAADERAHSRSLRQQLRDEKNRAKKLDQMVNTWMGLARALLHRVKSTPQDIRTFAQFRRDLRQTRREAELIKSARIFDEPWYLQQNPDVATAGLSTILHYLRFGWREGRDPSPDFSTWFYLNTYSDVRDAKVNPLVHYLTLGRLEGRQTKPTPVE
jgi:hypothetical protein